MDEQTSSCGQEAARTKKKNGVKGRRERAGKVFRVYRHGNPARSRDPEIPKSVNSRRKGASGEREFAEELRRNGWPNARRGQQRSGVDQADVIDGPPGVHWEVKRVEALNVWKAMAQAQRDAPAGALPAVAMRRNNGAWLAVVPLDAFLALLRAAEPGPIPPDDLWG